MHVDSKRCCTNLDFLLVAVEVVCMLKYCAHVEPLVAQVFVTMAASPPPQSQNNVTLLAKCQQILATMDQTPEFEEWRSDEPLDTDEGGISAKLTPEYFAESMSNLGQVETVGSFGSLSHLTCPVPGVTISEERAKDTQHRLFGKEPPTTANDIPKTLDNFVTAIMVPESIKTKAEWKKFYKSKGFLRASPCEWMVALLLQVDLVIKSGNAKIMASMRKLLQNMSFHFKKMDPAALEDQAYIQREAKMKQAEAVYWSFRQRCEL